MSCESCVAPDYISKDRSPLTICVVLRERMLEVLSGVEVAELLLVDDGEGTVEGDRVLHRRAQAASDGRSDGACYAAESFCEGNGWGREFL